MRRRYRGLGAGFQKAAPDVTKLAPVMTTRTGAKIISTGLLPIIAEPKVKIGTIASGVLFQKPQRTIVEVPPQYVDQLVAQYPECLIHSYIGGRENPLVVHLGCLVNDAAAIEAWMAGLNINTSVCPEGTILNPATGRCAYPAQMPDPLDMDNGDIYVEEATVFDEGLLEQAKNWVYDHPLLAVGGVLAAIVGGYYWRTRS